MIRTNQDIIGEQWIRNDGGALAVGDEDKKIAWRKYREDLLNTEFAQSNNSLSQADTISVPHSLDKNMARESISKMKNGKGAGPLHLVPKW